MLAPFHAALVACAGCALAASVCAFVWVRGNNGNSDDKDAATRR